MGGVSGAATVDPPEGPVKGVVEQAVGGYGVQVTLVFVLVLVNAVFAGSEMALVSLRESQLQRLERTSRAGRVLAKLARDPNRFLATIQIGITLAGFLASAAAAVSRGHRRRQQDTDRASGEDQPQLRQHTVELIASEPVAVQQQHRQGEDPEQQPESRLGRHRVRGAARLSQVAYSVGHAAYHRGRLSGEPDGQQPPERWHGEQSTEVTSAAISHDPVSLRW